MIFFLHEFQIGHKQLFSRVFIVSLFVSDSGRNSVKLKYQKLASATLIEYCLGMLQVEF